MFIRTWNTIIFYCVFFSSRRITFLRFYARLPGWWFSVSLYHYFVWFPCHRPTCTKPSGRVAAKKFQSKPFSVYVFFCFNLFLHSNHTHKKLFTEYTTRMDFFTNLIVHFHPMLFYIIRVARLFGKRLTVNYVKNEKKKKWNYVIKLRIEKFLERYELLVRVISAL